MGVFADKKDIAEFASSHAPHMALGYFDGVHLGHQSLLARVLQLAREEGGEPGVLLLEPHPQNVLQAGGGFRTINTLEERVALIRAFGDIHIFILPFDEDFAGSPPEAFVRDYLAGLLRIRTAVCGYNYRFGHKGAGGSRDLQSMGKAYGFGVSVLPQVTDRGEPVSSSEIRRLLGEGAMFEAYSRLGHCHAFSGNVVGGRKIGSSLGFPTANLDIGPERIWPARGVYGAFIRDGRGRILRGIVNAGVRPTVGDGGAPSFEIYLIDFQGDLYGSKLEAVLTDRLRPEQAFGSLEGLREQIGRDLTRAGSVLDAWEGSLSRCGLSKDVIFSCFIRFFPI